MSAFEMTVDEFEKFCLVEQPELRLERQANGDLLVAPYDGLESARQKTQVVCHLQQWAESASGGIASGNTGFVLPSGAVFAPTCCWISDERLRMVTRRGRNGFPRLCPEFVVEMMSRYNRLTAMRTKMEQWVAGGAALAWLIDLEQRTVYIYRPNEPPEARHDAASIEGEGPIAGFVLDLRRMWR